MNCWLTFNMIKFLFGEKNQARKTNQFLWARRQSKDIREAKFYTLSDEGACHLWGPSEFIFIQRWITGREPSNWTESKCAELIWIWLTLIRLTLPKLSLNNANWSGFSNEGRLENRMNWIIEIAKVNLNWMNKQEKNLSKEVGLPELLQRLLDAVVIKRVGFERREVPV